jgi:hypothetical protein
MRDRATPADAASEPIPYASPRGPGGAPVGYRQLESSARLVSLFARVMFAGGALLILCGIVLAVVNVKASDPNSTLGWIATVALVFIWSLLSLPFFALGAFLRLSAATALAVRDMAQKSTRP